MKQVVCAECHSTNPTQLLIRAEYRRMGWGEGCSVPTGKIPFMY